MTAALTYSFMLLNNIILYSESRNIMKVPRQVNLLHLNADQ